MNKQLWIEIKDLAQLNELKTASNKKLVVIFKHSTRCGISRMVFNQFEKQITSTEDIIFCYLDLLNYREISAEIENNFNVVHQSPQIILLRNEIVVSHDSHNQILELSINDFI